MIEDWKSCRVGDIFHLGRGRVISKDEIAQNPGDFPVYSSQSKNKGELGKIDSYDFDGEYLTWTTDGAQAGTVFYRSGKFNCTNVCGTAKPIDKDAICVSFFAQLLDTYAKRYVSYIGNPKLMNAQFAEIPIVVPPLVEQQKIAEILRTWDEALEKLNALRNAKERRLDGVTQRLLAPSRAIGNDIPQSNWRPYTFGDAFEERQDRNESLKADDVVTVGKYAIRKQSEHFTRSVASKDLSNYWVISHGDFVYDPMSAYYGAIGRFMSPADGIVSPAYRVLQLSSKVDPEFMVTLLRTHHIRFLLETRSSGGNKEGKRRLLQRDEFESIEFKLPSIEEQREIAAKISLFQAELDLTDREIEAVARQKRGLMQKLLTGEWRVEVSDEDEAAA